MTKFESEAIGVRSGRQKSGLPTVKERKKEMEQYLKTGVHASAERAKVQSAAALPTLPERDPHRPHAFMDFRVGTKTLGTHPAGKLACSICAVAACLLKPASPPFLLAAIFSGQQGLPRHLSCAR